jgi:hypothetical protein
MKESELRIGNYVNLIAEGHEKEPDTFKWDLEDYEFYYDRMNFIKPIPLTEDWLLKVGFWKDIDSRTFKVNNCTLQLDNYQDEGFMAIIFGEDLKLIKYVHQLQNLYFCLTNKELELCDI